MSRWILISNMYLRSSTKGKRVIYSLSMSFLLKSAAWNEKKGNDDYFTSSFGKINVHILCKYYLCEKQQWRNVFKVFSSPIAHSHTCHSKRNYATVSSREKSENGMFVGVSRAEERSSKYRTACSRLTSFARDFQYSRSDFPWPNYLELISVFYFSDVVHKSSYYLACRLRFASEVIDRGGSADVA